MKSQLSLGLVIEGNAAASSILRLRNLAEELGPIKSGMLRVARRLSNSLRAGYAVGDYEGLKSAGLILIRVPDAIAPRIVQELCAAELVVKGLSFVLCETWLNTSVLKPLQKLGASTATLIPAHASPRNWFMVEGQLTAVRKVRRFLDRNEARAFELRPGTKALYYAAELLAATLPLPMFAGAQQALRVAGVSGNNAQDLLLEMSRDMLRSFANGTHFALPGGASGCPPEIANEYLADLRITHPQFAALLDESLTLFSRNERNRRWISQSNEGLTHSS